MSEEKPSIRYLTRYWVSTLENQRYDSRKASLTDLIILFVEQGYTKEEIISNVFQTQVVQNITNPGSKEYAKHKSATEQGLMTAIAAFWGLPPSKIKDSIKPVVRLEKQQTVAKIEPTPSAAPSSVSNSPAQELPKTEEPQRSAPVTTKLKKLNPMDRSEFAHLPDPIMDERDLSEILGVSDE